MWLTWSKAFLFISSVGLECLVMLCDNQCGSKDTPMKSEIKAQQWQRDVSDTFWLHCRQTDWGNKTMPLFLFLGSVLCTGGRLKTSRGGELWVPSSPRLMMYSFDLVQSCGEHTSFIKGSCGTCRTQKKTYADKRHGQKYKLFNWWHHFGTMSWSVSICSKKKHNY